jgi:hypothetical protein
MKISTLATSLLVSLGSVGSPALAFSLAPSSSSRSVIAGHRQQNGAFYIPRMSSEDESNAVVDKETSIVEDFKEKQSFTSSDNSKKVSTYTLALSSLAGCWKLVYYGMVWYGMVWYGMVWYGIPLL